MKSPDPIVNEVREIREALSKEYEYDVEKLARAIQAEEVSSGGKFVRFSPRWVAPARKAS